MEYERIHKPLPHEASGFSPMKLRAMLLGLEKRRKAEGEEEQKMADVDSQLETRRASAAESGREVEFSTTAETSMSSSGHRARIRAQDEDGLDSDSVSSGFNFPKAERVGPKQRLPAAPIVLPLSKPTPSKWDDAQKWIGSPTSNQANRGIGGQVKKSALASYGSRQAVAKVVVQVPGEADMKSSDVSQAKMGVGWPKTVSWSAEPPPLADSGVKPRVVADSLADFATVNIAAPTVRPVLMRDTGTEMTPVASQEPSRTGTPVKASTPTRSPTPSRSSTPARTPRNVTQIEPTSCHGEEDLHAKTRREIMVLGQQLGKTSIVAWASKEKVEEADASVKNVMHHQPDKSNIETRASDWEEVEKNKCLARFKREEMKIQAWESDQKAKIEAEMKKIDVEVERKRAIAQEKLKNKLAASQLKADKKRAVAEARRNRQAARTSQHPDYIRHTGRAPSPSCWNWCL